MTPSNVTTIFSGFSTSLSTILVDNLPLVVGIMAGLIGLGILIRYVVMWVGGSDVAMRWRIDRARREEGLSKIDWSSSD